MNAVRALNLTNTFGHRSSWLRGMTDGPYRRTTLSVFRDMGRVVSSPREAICGPTIPVTGAGHQTADGFPHCTDLLGARWDRVAGVAFASSADNTQPWDHQLHQPASAVLYERNIHDARGRTAGITKWWFRAGASEVGSQPGRGISWSRYFGASALRARSGVPNDTHSGGLCIT